ncbi:MAG: TolB family protein [Chloroflexota bacterium]
MRLQYVLGRFMIMAISTLVLIGTTQTSYTYASALERICPGIGIQPRPVSPDLQGLILTTWDRRSIWVYDIRRNVRYPLPNTAPCGQNCHLTADATRITYFDIEQGAFGSMRVDGTGRDVLADNATEVSWWDGDRLLVWSTSHEAYLLDPAASEIEPLSAPGLVSVQPGGYHALIIYREDTRFMRAVVDTRLATAQRMPGEMIPIGEDVRYFNAAAWSPDGTYLAAVVPQFSGNHLRGAEIVLIDPALGVSHILTDLTSYYGRLRINGHQPGELSWSPVGDRIAFWVIGMNGSDPEVDAGTAYLHVLDVDTGTVRVYCDYATTVHTPNPPRLVWSPDGRTLVFGSAATVDEQVLLLALDIETGVFTQLSADMMAVLGRPDVISWGIP